MHQYTLQRLGDPWEFLVEPLVNAQIPFPNHDSDDNRSQKVIDMNDFAFLAGHKHIEGNGDQYSQQNHVKKPELIAPHDVVSSLNNY
jgi:hypothetical protein